METLKTWPRAILLVDMNAFFASIEQRDFPELRGRPVAVTNGAQGTCIITSSYEARAYGIKTGMRLREARKLCPGLIQRPARPGVYAKTSTAIMKALQAVSPEIEVFSVDEAFLDVTASQTLFGSIEAIAHKTQELVCKASGIGCSIGMSGDKTTAKYAAKLHKPNGVTIIPPWESKQRLRNVPVTELCGINKGIGGYLAERGVIYCGDMDKLPISELGRRFGNIGRRIWLMTQGEDPDTLHTEVPDPKSIGHGKVMPPNTDSEEVVHLYLSHMTTKVSERLRKHGLLASHFFVGLRTSVGWIGGKLRTTFPTNSTRIIHDCCWENLRQHWQGEGVSQIQITALNPSTAQQLDLFGTSEPQRNADQVVDQINSRFGQYAIVPARLLNRSAMPDVIAPAWKPDGHRQTIQD